MNRRISRRIEFSAEEIRDALILKLDSASQNVPKDPDGSSITLTSDGAVLVWDETHQMDL